MNDLERRSADTFRVAETSQLSTLPRPSLGLRLLLASLVLLLASLADVAQAADGFRIFAPSRSKGSLLVVDAVPTAEGLKLALSQRVDLDFPAGTITQHADRPLLYVAAAGGKEGDTPGAVITLDGKGKYLRHEPVTLNHGYSYMSLDRSGRYLLGVNYGGGQVDVYALDDTGMPGKITAALDEGRRNAHCVLPSPDNRFIYIPYVKDTNAIYQYRFDAETGRLEPLDPKNADPPKGTGPRHMAYHPKLPLVYFSNEQHLGVSVYEKPASGQLELRQVCDAVDDKEPKQGVSSSDIVITPDARFLFAGIRGHSRDFDWISRYRILSNGEIELLGLTRADKIPWGLALSPDARHLLVTAFQGASLTAYRIAENGGLTKVAHLPWDKQITDLVTVAR